MTPREHRAKNLRDEARALFYLLVVSFGSSSAAYYRLFIGFSEPDREGSLMISVKQFLEGHRLYDEVFTQAGPAYYFLQWVVHRLPHIPVTHDFTRVFAVVMWCGSAFLASWFVWRVTRSIVFASLAHLIMAILLCASYGTGVWLTAALGMLCAGILFTQAHLGVCLVLAVALAIALHAKRGRAWKVTTGLFIASAAFAVSMLTPLFALVLLSSAAALWFGLHPARFPTVHLPAVRACAIGLTIALAGLFGFVWLQGSSFGAVYDSLFRQLAPRPVIWQAQVWLAMPIAAVSVFLAWRHRPSPLPFLPALRLVLALALIAAALARVSAPLVWCGLPFLWLTLIVDERPFGRSMLCLTGLGLAGISQSLALHPPDSGQLQFANLAVSLAAIIWLYDSLRTPTHKLATAAAVATIVTYAVLSYSSLELHERLPRLALPGTYRVRLDDYRQVATYRWLAINLARGAETFVANPGMPSLTFWSGVQPPNSLSTGELAVMEAVSQYGRVMAVYNSRLAKTGGSQPLARFIDDDFETIGRVCDYQLRWRKGPPEPWLTYCGRLSAGRLAIDLPPDALEQVHSVAVHSILSRRDIASETEVSASPITVLLPPEQYAPCTLVVRLLDDAGKLVGLAPVLDD